MVSTLNFLLNFLADLVQVGILVVGEEMRGQERREEMETSFNEKLFLRESFRDCLDDYALKYCWLKQ